MRVVQPTYEHLSYLVEHMRELDRRELGATGANFETLPGMILRYRVFAFAAVESDGTPVAAWGMMQQRPGVGAGWAFGTNRWRRAVPAMMDNITNWVLPFLIDTGFHRVEAAALAYRADVRKFLELIGAKPEAVLQQWGRNGEDFIEYRWLADEYRAQTRAADRHIGH